MHLSLLVPLFIHRCGCSKARHNARILILLLRRSFCRSLSCSHVVTKRFSSERIHHPKYQCFSLILRDNVTAILRRLAGCLQSSSTTTYCLKVSHYLLALSIAQLESEGSYCTRKGCNTYAKMKSTSNSTFAEICRGNLHVLIGRPQVSHTDVQAVQVNNLPSNSNSAKDGLSTSFSDFFHTKKLMACVVPSSPIFVWNSASVWFGHRMR